MEFPCCRAVVLGCCLTIPNVFAEDHAEDMARSLALFQSDVGALLSEHCVRCHDGTDLETDLDLRTRESLLLGSVFSGIVVVPGSAADSVLVDQLEHRAKPYMPRKEPRLPADAIARIAEWIDLGAAYDGPLEDTSKDASPAPMQVTDADRDYWAYRPLETAYPLNASIDHYLRARQGEHGLKMAPAASRRALIRRLHFDLLGLPPEPAEVDAFLSDTAPGAYERLVDRLLANPHFGERWARHWLDIARFAESHGFEHDYDRKHAYHYRDFVIRAFNQDMPYDRFVQWQLAGDELAPGNPMALMATGFLCAGVHPTQITISDAERLRYDALDDMLATTGSAMMGLTIGCARCHDHKYDPIPTRDYYRMLSTFKATVRTRVKLDLGALPGAAPAEPVQPVMICSEGEHVKAWRSHKSSKEIPDFYPELYFLDNGDPRRKGDVAEPGFLRVLTAADANPDERWPGTRAETRTSGSRAALAAWLTDTNAGAGALLARVVVNRLWQHHFGIGIVATPNNFGRQGARPTHPMLLDWLAGELIRNDWRLKPIHKLMVMSEAYRQNGEASGDALLRDPRNQYLTYRSPRRLEVEAMRDAALVASGLLDRTPYGPGTLDENNRRRTIYFTIKRSELVPSLQVFDWPDALTSQGRRTSTTTPSQALVMMNDPNYRLMAEAFAERISGSADPVLAAYEIAYGRSPLAGEWAAAQEFVATQATSYGGDLTSALTDFCAALMSAHEFVFVE